MVQIVNRVWDKLLRLSQLKKQFSIHEKKDKNLIVILIINKNVVFNLLEYV